MNILRKLNFVPTVAVCLVFVLGAMVGDTFGQYAAGQYPQYDTTTAPRTQMNYAPNHPASRVPVQRLSRYPRGSYQQVATQVQGVQEQLPAPLDDFAHTIRVKDITSIAGHRSNRVHGMGLVTGLKGTGGKGKFTQDAARNVFKNFGMLADEMPVGSMAVVSVTAEIPSFKRPGQEVYATVSAVDGATGLYGGELLMTSLKGIDKQAYAVAGGPMVVGGFSAGGAGGGVAKNHDTSAKVKATVEVAMDDEPAFPGRTFRLLLHNQDNATAYRIATEINRIFPNHAQASDQGCVDVMFPRTYYQNNNQVGFVVLVGDLRITPDVPARVVINQKSGTIVVGQNVRLSKVMFGVGNLIVSTTEAPVVSQPAPLSQGETVVVPRTQISATETGGRYNIINPQTTVGDLAAALNTLGVTPQDLINVFQTIDASGALQGTLEIE